LPGYGANSRKAILELVAKNPVGGAPRQISPYIIFI
jgi:hypothetical protein